MIHADRIAAYESLFGTFLGSARERGYIVIENAAAKDEYVQFKLLGGRVFGELGSRQWTDPERPLSPTAVAGLLRLGFTGGGPEQNYVRDGLAATSAELAELTERLFRTAYELDEEYAINVDQLVFNDVPMPRTQPFTRDMIEHHLRSHDLRFLRDQDGDFCVEFTPEEGAEPVVIWLCATGDEQALYRIVSASPRGPRPATREQALEHCNAWNRDHHWPTAVVHDDAERWDILTGAAMDTAPGVTQQLVDAFTHNAITGAFAFWNWLRDPQETAASSRPADDETGEG